MIVAAKCWAEKHVHCPPYDKKQAAKCEGKFCEKPQLQYLISLHFDHGLFDAKWGFLKETREHWYWYVPSARKVDTCYPNVQFSNSDSFIILLGTEVLPATMTGDQKLLGSIIAAILTFVRNGIPSPSYSDTGTVLINVLLYFFIGYVYIATERAVWYITRLQAGDILHIPEGPSPTWGYIFVYHSGPGGPESYTKVPPTWRGGYGLYPLAGTSGLHGPATASGKSAG